MKFEFYSPDDITSLTTDSLWKQGVCMDDWDYMIFFEDDTIELKQEKNRWTFELSPANYEVSRLLNGCCSNTWYLVSDFMGRKGVLGVAYHS